VRLVVGRTSCEREGRPDLGCGRFLGVLVGAIVLSIDGRNHGRHCPVGERPVVGGLAVVRSQHEESVVAAHPAEVEPGQEYREDRPRRDLVEVVRDH
jgi:hypothetical protein